MCAVVRHHETRYPNTPPGGNPFPKMGGVFIGRRLEACVQRRPEAGTRKNAAYKVQAAGSSEESDKGATPPKQIRDPEIGQQGSRRSVSIAPRSGTRDRRPPKRGQYGRPRSACLDHRAIIFRVCGAHTMEVLILAGVGLCWWSRQSRRRDGLTSQRPREYYRRVAKRACLARCWWLGEQATRRL